jgi:RNA polymerase sigma-70 factor (sigma-E family)
VKKVPSGDFDAFVRARGDALYRYAYLLTMHRHDAEDLVQTVLLNVAPRWESVSRAEDIEAYLRRALANRAVSRHRWRARHPERLVAELGEAALVSPDTALDASSALAVSLAALPPRQRAVIVLRFYEQLTERETADRLGCTIGTVKSQTSKALASLRLAAASADTAESTWRDR